MADFQEHVGEFEERGVKLVAASVDSEDDARKFVEEHDLGFPVGHGLDHEDVAKRFGAFYDADKPCLHATAFLVRPGGEIAIASYSTGALGRFQAETTLKMIDYYRQSE